MRAAGTYATFQDAGRPGHAAVGLGASGAADLPALGLANRLAGAAEDAPAIEVVLGGLFLVARRATRVALTGARRPVLVNGRGAPMDAPIDLAAGDEIRVGHGGRGVYSYLAVSGGFLAERVLGSAATDSLSGVGPPPLAAGDVLAADSLDVPSTGVDIAPVDEAAETVELRVMPGPRADWFDDGVLEALCRAPWTVSPMSSRVGVRLDEPSGLGATPGRRLVRVRVGELAPEGMVRGAIQVPPDGRPVILGPDHPVTGGYPVPAVVVASDLAAAAQCEPGRRVRFRPARRR